MRATDNPQDDFGHVVEDVEDGPGEGQGQLATVALFADAAPLADVLLAQRALAAVRHLAVPAVVAAAVLAHVRHDLVVLAVAVAPPGRASAPGARFGIRGSRQGTAESALLVLAALLVRDLDLAWLAVLDAAARNVAHLVCARPVIVTLVDRLEVAQGLGVQDGS